MKRLSATLAGISALMLVAVPAAPAQAHTARSATATVYFDAPGPTKPVAVSRIHVTSCGIDDDPFECDVHVGRRHGLADLADLVDHGARFPRKLSWHQHYAKGCQVYVGRTLRYSNAAHWKPLHLAKDGSGDLIVHHGKTRGRVVPRFWLRALDGHAE